jgi:hypothetical protein
MVHFYIPASSSVTISDLTGDEGIRRILCYSSGASTSNLLYKSITIGNFNNNSCLDIDFKSYYGFPKLSDFSIESAPNVTISILADIVPYSVTADDYIETREVI